MSAGSPLVVGCAGVLALALNVGGVAAFRRSALARRLLDVPNIRSSHTVPTPRGGGVVLVAVTLVGMFAALALGVAAWRPDLAWLGAAVVAVAVVSWIEDLRRVPLGVRLGVHAAAAVVAVLALGIPDVVAVPLVGAIRPGLLGAIVAVVWIVGFANAFNFMDGIDGIAGAQALVASLGWLALAKSGSGEQWIAILVAAGSLGFLVFNWAPAKVFMGDVGAVFLGFVLAVLPLAAGRAEPRVVLAGVLLVWPFVFDAAFTLARRLARRENVLAAHRSHLYQRLVIAGWSHAEVSALYGGLAAAGAAAAWLWAESVTGSGALVVAVTGITALGLWVTVLAAERARSRARSSG